MKKSLRVKWRTFTFSIACLILAFSTPTWAAPLKVALVDTPVSITKVYMLKHILEVKTEHRIDLIKTSVDGMWQGLINGDLDASVSVILPKQQAQFDQYRNQVEDLGPNWIGKEITIHTIVSKDLMEQDVPLVRFLNNYCLCGKRLESAKVLLKDNKISREDAIAWMDKHKPWLHNMMGFARPYEDREDRNVTY
jgi:ABC-type proline/glycine betaine transport system substrate-binding protein